MPQWLTSIGPHLVWPAMLIIGVLAIAIIWKIADAIYEQLSGIMAGAAFMVLGLGLVLYCGYYLVSHQPLTSMALFFAGVGVLAGIGALGAGAFGLRNASDF